MDIHERIVSLVGEQLTTDGFTKPSDADVFVRPITGPWRAWISVPGDSYTVDPMAGLMNDELDEIFCRARGMAGMGSTRRPDGPPIIMVDLEKLAADCAACSTEAPWEYHGEVLSEDVAHKLVECLRNYAYPFFDKYASLEGLINGSRDRMPGFAYQWFAPIIYIKLGQVDVAKTYAANYARHVPVEELSSQYQKYFEAVLKLLA